MKKKIIDKLSNEEIITILKEIISGKHNIICPCYISYNKNEIYHWFDNEFKNKFEGKLHFSTFYRQK